MKKILIILIGCSMLFGCTEYKAKKLYEQGQRYEEQFEWGKALSTYNTLLYSYPKSKIVPQTKINMKQCKGKIAQINSLIDEANILYQNKKYEDSIKKSEEVLKLNMPSEHKEIIQQKLELAQLNLADEYYNKKGNKNKKKAFALFKELAEKGYSYAQYSLGFMLQNGQGTSINKVEAEKWYRKAAEQGDESSKKEIEKIEKYKKLDIQTADRKSYQLYNLLGKDITDVLRITGGNYDVYKEEILEGYQYMCYYFGGHLMGGYWSSQYKGAYVGGYRTDVVTICHEPGSKIIVGVSYKYAYSGLDISNMPKLEYNLPKSFSNLKYKSEDIESMITNTKRTYHIGNEEWYFSIVYDFSGNARIAGYRIFLR